MQSKDLLLGFIRKNVLSDINVDSEFCRSCSDGFQALHDLHIFTAVDAVQIGGQRPTGGNMGFYGLSDLIGQLAGLHDFRSGRVFLVGSDSKRRDHAHHEEHDHGFDKTDPLD
ncbi:hypothetical protein GCM10023116_48990 [Kistimonas scapharcae]|uniref:Uncharacterized protein n=1 Tax=Kistimonas scapharcae TaxID=1036133 RepID=A0ABP8VBI3_9GAMM